MSVIFLQFLTTWRNRMINTATKSTGVMNRNSILSINVPEKQSVKNQNNIMTLIKNPRTNSASVTSGQSQDKTQQTTSYNQPQNRTQQVTPRNQSQQTAPYNQPQNRTQQRPQTRSPRQPQNIQPALTAGQQNTASTPGTPTAKPVPILYNKVQKGQKTLLPISALNVVNACFGWNITGARCDVDVSAFLLGANGKVIGDSWFVFYGQTISPDHSTKFIEGGSTDRELIQIDFTRLNSQVKKIVFVLTINDALKNRLHFGMLKDAYIRIMDQSGKELVSFLMTEYYNNVISMMIGELYLHNDAWKFNAIGNGVAKDLAGLCELYGVQVL